MKFILGKKENMSEYFSEEGEVFPVTIVSAGPITVTRVFSKDTDGYNSIQVGYGTQKKERITKPKLGQMGGVAYSTLKEFRLKPADKSEAKVGDDIDVSAFVPGDKIMVSSISKGKGFQGVVKRHHYAGGPESHGSMFHRHPGSMGASSYPSRVWKGKTLPGHMGAKRITAQRLKVIESRPDENLLFVRGAIPGAANGLIMVRKSKKG